MIIKRIISPATPSVISKLYSLLVAINAPAVNKFLIYADPAYPAYLANIIDNSSDDQFYIAESDNQLAGFAHFKKVKPDTIHLNNIIIADGYRSNNAGKKLLTYAINKLRTDMPGLKNFTLDVFGSNAGVFDWYKRLGMLVTDQSNWYNITGIFEQGIDKPRETEACTILKDENGFQGIYVNGLKLASLINNNALVFRDDVNLFENLHSLKELVEKENFNSAILITKHKYDFPLMDVSYRLSVDLSNLTV